MSDGQRETGSFLSKEGLPGRKEIDGYLEQISHHIGMQGMEKSKLLDAIIGYIERLTKENLALSQALGVSFGVEVNPVPKVRRIKLPRQVQRASERTEKEKEEMEQRHKEHEAFLAFGKSLTGFDHVMKVSSLEIAAMKIEALELENEKLRNEELDRITPTLWCEEGLIERYMENLKTATSYEEFYKLLG